MLTYELSGDADTTQSISEKLPVRYWIARENAHNISTQFKETRNYKYFSGSCRLLETSEHKNIPGVDYAEKMEFVGCGASTSIFFFSSSARFD
jgi:hypothetical protein